MAETSNLPVIAVEAIVSQIVAVFEALGVSTADAAIAADVLVTASLRGVDTHGVTTVVRYARELESGVCLATAAPRVLADAPSLALLDGGGGLGLVMARHAMAMAIEKAAVTGVGQVALTGGRHVGMLAYYPMMAARAGMIGVAVSNASPAVRPAGGLRARLGVNPLAFAAPGGDGPDLVFDMSTSAVAGSKIAGAHRRGESIPEGWAVDAHGVPLTEAPGARSEAWSMNPLGGSAAEQGHKGYGLGLLVDVLGGVLSGGGYSATLSMGENMSWVMAVDISKIRPLPDFTDMMTAMARDLGATPPESPGVPVRLPGAGAAQIERQRRGSGIPIEPQQLEDIRALARRLGLAVVV